MSAQESCGARLRRMREASGLSQTALAKLVGISRPLLSGIESGRRRISRDVLSALFWEGYDLGIDLGYKPSDVIPIGRGTL